ncbi:MAG: hypothetical protein AAF581_11155 [Planctomycetota bacterium]
MQQLPRTEGLPDNVIDELRKVWQRSSEECCALAELLHSLESDSERWFLVNFVNRFPERYHPVNQVALTGNAYGAIVDVVPQEKLHVGSSFWRPDFTIHVQPLGGKRSHFCVELNGYQFHHATEAQVRRDYEKYRAFSCAGVVLLPYSSSELLDNPRSVAGDVDLQIRKRARQVMGAA